MSEFTDKIDELVVHLETAHTTLVSAEKRIAELENALEPFANYMGGHFDKDNSGEPLPDGLGVGWVYLTHADFRRARSTLPPKITGGE